MTLTWYFEEESTPATEALLDRVAATGAAVPCLWRPEVANGFQAALRRRRIDAAYLERAQRRSLPLATLDKELRAAAPALNLELLGTA
jgi:hypothetical protein